MGMNSRNKGLIEIHSAVFLFGISGLFGKLLTISPIIIVLGRVLFSSICLFFIVKYLHMAIKLKCRLHYGYFGMMGMLLAIHWCTFFQSIQVSTVAIGLLTFSTFPIFVTFLEPYFFKEKLYLSDIAAAAITFLGVLLVVPHFKMGNTMTQGVIWGILSGFSYAALSMLNRKFVKAYASVKIAFYEQGTAVILLLPFLLLQQPVFKTRDVMLLLALGVFFTGISHIIFIDGLKYVKTKTAGIISSLEPMYGIVFSLLLLGEIPSIRELVGGSLILTAVFYATLKKQ